MGLNPWQSDPGDVAKCLATLERRRAHLATRLAEPNRAGASLAYDQAEARALDMAGAALLRAYVEIVTGNRIEDLIRDLSDALPEGPLRSRAEKFVAMLAE